jgi:S-adenosylmethionine-diacylglycerol 3-amino-3-carboxypropyl transferase
MTPFFSRLSYSFGNEDWQTEQEALKIQPEDRVVSITGSGDRPLHLLLSECKQLVSVDANPFQTQLLLLKAAAMQALSVEDYQAFLGITEHPNRLSLFSSLLPYLSFEAMEFWKMRSKMIQKGIIYQGKTEKLCKVLAKMVGLLRGPKIEKLFSFHDLEEQKQFVQRHWNSSAWKAGVEMALHPMLTRLFFKDPGLYAHLGEGIRPGAYILDRMSRCLNQHLAKHALLISLVLRGYVSEDALPPYLIKEGVEQIKPRLSRLQTKTQNIISYLESTPDASIDVFSLSDVASYVPADQFERLQRAVFRTAAHGARFCMRQFMSNHHLIPELSKHFQRDQVLEETLENEDRCFVYRFIVGKILKN